MASIGAENSEFRPAVTPCQRKGARAFPESMPQHAHPVGLDPRPRSRCQPRHRGRQGARRSADAAHAMPANPSRNGAMASRLSGLVLVLDVVVILTPSRRRRTAPTNNTVACSVSRLHLLVEQRAGELQRLGCRAGRDPPEHLFNRGRPSDHQGARSLITTPQPRAFECSPASGYRTRLCPTARPGWD